MGQSEDDTEVDPPRLHTYTALLRSPRRWVPVTLGAATAAAALLLATTVMTAAVAGRLAWPAAGVILVASGFLYLAPVSTLAYERTRDAMLGPMLARLDAAQRADLVAWMSRLRVRGSLVVVGLVPPGLAVLAYVSATGLFQDVLAVGGATNSSAWPNLVWLVTGGVLAGVGVAASLESIWFSLAFMRYPEPWNPLRPAVATNREDVSHFALFATTRFVIAGGWLLPGVIAVAVVLEGGGLGAVLAIASTVLLTGAALLVLPALAIQRRSKADKRDHLRELAARIEPLHHRLESGESQDPQRDYYNLRCLLAIRDQLLHEPASPDSIDLVRQLPRTTVVPLLATLMSVPFV